jgi:hypothetical protein
MTHAQDRRHFLQAVPVAIAGLVFGRAALAQTAQAKEAITVYKDPSCTCCHKWVEHMQANGFVATVTDGNMSPVKARFKIPPALESCHTTIVRGFIIEGHVPARREAAPHGKTERHRRTHDSRNARERARHGWTPFRPYEVLSFDSTGKTTVYAKHDKA